MSAPAAGADEAPAAAYCAGDVIATKYRLISVLGEGGMGSVWLARNLALDVDVALKLIRRGMASIDASSRLLQEARAAARLEHPSIVRVFDFGETEHKDPFIVMELLRGDSLGELLDRKGRLAAHHAVRILLPIASALAVAHDKGIVHRDLKPDNVFLARSDLGSVVPKIVDFGIAKLKREPAARHTTQAGVVLGSPDYMSPEQARGKGEVDEASDVWALAVVLYESVTGHRPFGGENYNEQISAILLDDPEPITEFSAGDQALWQIIERGLAKERAQRWQSMREFGRALAEWALSHGIAADVCGTSLVDHWVADVEHTFSEMPQAGGSGAVLVQAAMRASLSSIPPSPTDSLASPGINPRDSLANALRSEMPSLPSVRPPVELRRDATPVPSVDGAGETGRPRSSWPFAASVIALLAGAAVAVVFYGARIRAAAPWLPLPEIAATTSTAEPPPPQPEGGLAAAGAEPMATAPSPSPTPMATASATATASASASGTPVPLPSAGRPAPTPGRGPWPPPPRAPASTAQPAVEAPPAPTDPKSKLKNPFE